MAVGIESEEVAKGLDDDDGARDGILLRWNGVKSLSLTLAILTLSQAGKTDFIHFVWSKIKI